MFSPKSMSNLGHLTVSHRKRVQERLCITRRKIRLIEVSAKCCHLKKFTSKGTFRQVLSEFIDWRYPISCVHSVMLVF
jgi:hypothetical protein